MLLLFLNNGLGFYRFLGGQKPIRYIKQRYYRMTLSKKLLSVFGVAAIFAVTSPDAAIAADGAKVFKKCAACHSTEAGKHKVGPCLLYTSPSPRD